MPRLPAYERIREALREELRARSAGDRVPSESDLAARYGVTRVTIRHALSGLAAEGRVVRQQGRGTFVGEQSLPSRPLTALSSFTEDAQKAGGVTTSQLLASEIVPAPDDVRDALSLKEDAAVVHIARVRCVNGERVALQHAWIPAGRCPNLPRETLVEGSLYRTLEQRYGIRLLRAERRISATAATRQQAALLGVAMRSPLLRIEQRTFDDNGGLVEFAESWMCPGHTLFAQLERNWTE